MKIRVVIIEDHALFRSGLKQLLAMNDAIDVIGESGTAEEGIALCEELQPDLLLLDVSLTGMCGITATPILKNKCPNMKILIISMYENQEYIRSAFKAGVHGYLLKTADSDEFFFAIQTVFRGTNYISSELTSAVLGEYLNQGSTDETQDMLNSLTVREKEILVSVAKGFSNKEIATEYNIAEKTVSAHRVNFMKKLSLHNVREVTVFAVKHNLIEIE